MKITACTVSSVEWHILNKCWEFLYHYTHLLYLSINKGPTLLLLSEYYIINAQRFLLFGIVLNIYPGSARYSYKANVIGSRYRQKKGSGKQTGDAERKVSHLWDIHEENWPFLSDGASFSRDWFLLLQVSRLNPLPYTIIYFIS